MKKRSLISLILLGILILILALLVGPTNLGFEDLWGASADPVKREIFFSLRLPRVLCGIMAGGGLAVSGVIYQNLFRNPLACPFSLGVSGGASFGAAFASIFSLSFAFLGFGAVTLFGITGALSSILIIFLLARFFRTQHGLLLAGIVLTFFWGSLVTLLQYVADLGGVFKLSRWMMGSLQVVGYRELSILSASALLTLLISLLYSKECDLLAFGDDFAATRGVNVRRVRQILFVITSIFVGIVVACCGVIGFVGIIVPHLCRSLIGSISQRLIPLAFCVGAYLLVLCDTFGRIVISPNEVPVGVFTALLGGPFFLIVMLRNVRGREAD